MDGTYGRSTGRSYRRRDRLRDAIIFFGLFLPRLSLFLAHQAAFLGASLFFSLLLLLLYYLFLILELYTEGRAQQRITA